MSKQTSTDQDRPSQSALVGFSHNKLTKKDNSAKCGDKACAQCQYSGECFKYIWPYMREFEVWTQKHEFNEGLKYQPTKVREFVFFSLRFSKKEYKRHKDRMWHNWVPYLFNGIKGIAVVLLPVLGMVLSSLIEKINDISIITKFLSDFSMWLLVGGPIVLAIVCLASILHDWDKQKERKETWVRHSSRYNRLDLALREFCISKQTVDDFNTFVDKVLLILYRNLDQFELNLSGKGLTPYPNKSSEIDTEDKTKRAPSEADKFDVMGG